MEGVGLEVFDWVVGVGPRPGGAAGENLEGTVPARGLRDVVAGSDGGRKSGKPSWLGDSGMVSRRGVEPPLAGGPKYWGIKPSDA